MRKVLAGTIGCVVMATMLTACGGGGGSSSDSGKKDTEFTSLFDKSKTATARVTYENHNDDGSVSDTYTVSQRGDGTKAFINEDSKWVVKDGKAFTCDNADTPEANCEEVPGGPDAVNALVNGFAAGYAGFIGFWATSASSIGFSKKTTDTIAGRSAECREITIAGGTSGIAKKILNATGIGGLGWAACLDSQTGVPLRFTALGGKTKVETVAVKFEDPKDSDFETPTTTTTTEGDISDTTDTTEPDSSSITTEGDGSTSTTECTPMTLPNGVTVPSGITLPCAPAING